MLSRVAERIYWVGRYLERAESMARLVSAYTNQILDLPKEVDPGWGQLIFITGSEELFYGHYQNPDERNVMKFLLADAFNPSAILSCLVAARENVRTTREQMPVETWENINELYLYVKNNIQKGITRRGRYYFLKNVVFRCQQITGLLAGTMSHDAAYDFARIGRNLERGDMSTRIVDSAIAILMPRTDAPGPYDNILWVNVLKSLGAFQMYRQHVQSRVKGRAVVRFLLLDTLFPRSLAHSIAEVEACVTGLPRNERPLRSIARLRGLLKKADIGAMDLEELHVFIDKLQLALSKTHEQIRHAWFKLDDTQPTAA